MAGVAEQDDEDLLEPGRVTGHRGGAVGRFETPEVVLAGDAGVADAVHDERYEIGRLALQGAACVQPGRQRQVLDQQGRPARLGLDPPERVPGLGSGLLPATGGEFGTPADGGEGVRSSWLASATNCRTRVSLSWRACRAPWTWSSIRFSAAPTRPASVCGSHSDTAGRAPRG